jgi:hypothetical protein
MRGTIRKISLPRRFVTDLMWASAGVPFVSLRRTLDVSQLAEARTSAAEPPGWAAIFVKAFGLVAKDEPVLRTLYASWPWPHFYELPRTVASVAIARVEDDEDCVLPERVAAPEMLPLTTIDEQIRYAKKAPIRAIPAFRKIMRTSRLPLPLRRLAWLVAANFGRQHGNWIGNVSVTSVSAIGPGELHAISPGPYILSYDVVGPDRTVDVVIRWDHRVTDAAFIARTLTRLEQALNTEIAAELREPKAACRASPDQRGRDLTDGRASIRVAIAL